MFSQGSPIHSVTSPIVTINHIQIWSEDQNSELHKEEELTIWVRISWYLKTLCHPHFDAQTTVAINNFNSFLCFFNIFPPITNTTTVLFSSSFWILACWVVFNSSFLNCGTQRRNSPKTQPSQMPVSVPVSQIQLTGTKLGLHCNFAWLTVKVLILQKLWSTQTRAHCERSTSHRN